MSLNGVSGVGATLIRPQEPARPRVEQERAQPASIPQPAATPARISGAALLSPRHEALPAEAPDGTDPALWAVLTTDERSVFARMSSMGPLTYGRASNPLGAQPNGPGERPMVRGGRLDVKA